MKHGKKPNRQQKLLMSKYKIDSSNWLVVKNLNDELVVSHRETGRLRTLDKSVMQ
ncbi:hypothetical protein SAMN05421839_13916 [Halolactibacillus halophilus]|uniref:DUF6906 domain-containing protein n=1 Tax=Halolactibacillus halophilus TaxID=306540 RepID=A0A1I5S552_9BACI|nr:hypothetical protein [Halolactibacillus halophilus]GEM02925.1 hypothetical protein HHA03_24570 [Halolactibacillus halophilus]SFP65832.1 hypothetical protein SAMN05421839_13916 [Halolactibacillus halophilus]